jgi:steroid delta-isomerase-like uncharacterized protein
MRKEKARDVIEAGFRAWNAGDLDGVLRDYDENAAVWASGLPAELHGKEQIGQAFRGLLTAFPGCQLKVTNIIESGNWVVVESSFSGTHKGPFVTPGGTIPATDKTVEVPFVNIYELRDGKTVTERGYFDNLDLMTQLGRVPSPAARAL